MRNKKEEIKSINETILSKMSIEELESRLEIEEIDARGEMWTGCGCADVCTGQWDPNPDCIPHACLLKGTW